MAIKLTESKLRQVIREEIENLTEAGLPGYDRWKTEPGPYGTGYESDNEQAVLDAVKALIADRKFVDALVSMGATSIRQLTSDILDLIKGDVKLQDLIRGAGLDPDSHDDILDVASNTAGGVNTKMSLGLR